MTGSKNEKVKKKVWFAKNVKMPMETSMLYIIDGDTFYLLMKNTLIGDSGASHHITKDNTSLFDVINIHNSIQGSFRNMSAMKKGKLCINIQQIDGTKWVCTLCSVKFCAKVGANLFSLKSRFQVTNRTTSWLNLLVAMSSLIAKSKLMTTG